jgi:hypothetical protein
MRIVPEIDPRHTLEGEEAGSLSLIPRQQPDVSGICKHGQ